MGRVYLELAAKLITHDVKSWTQLNPAVLEWAAALKDDGYQLGIISNMVRKFWTLCKPISIGCEQDLFNSQIYSCHWRVTAGSTDLPDQPPKQLGLEPEDCLFIDDLEVNIEAAQKLGFAVFHYQGPTALENLQSYFASRTD